MATLKKTRYDEELGKALVDRLGLDPNSTLQEWSAEGAGDVVWVTMTTMKGLPQSEFNELCAVAEQRATQNASELPTTSPTTAAPQLQEEPA